jgi:probable HAF family extracellular repeat protein
MRSHRTAGSKVIGWAILVLAVSTPALATDFHFTTIRVPESVGTSARGINARGDIVGHYESQDGATHAFLMRKGVITTIDFPGSVSTSAKGINARGDIVGDFTDEQGGWHSYLLSDGKFTQIDYPGASATVAFGINNASDITGRWYDDAGTELGFLLKNGTFYRVSVPDSGLTSVSGAQDNGRVLVGDTNLESGLHGFIRSRPGHYELIDYPGPEPVEFTIVRWINQRGDIVGVTGDSSWFGFLLRDGQYTRIDVDFTGASTTRPLAINDDGVIVGDYINQWGRERGFRAVPVQ